MKKSEHNQKDVDDDKEQIRFYPSIMDLYFEEEDSTDFEIKDSSQKKKKSIFSSSDDDSQSLNTDENSNEAESIEENSDEPKKKQTKKKQAKKKVTIKRKVEKEYKPEDKANIDKLDIPQDVKDMIDNNSFYPFDCHDCKKSIVTINRLLYLLQRMNKLSMDYCTILTQDDSRRIYDYMNVFTELELVTKISGSSPAVSPVLKSSKKKGPNFFQFCSQETTDNPIDLKEIKKYLT